MNALHSLRTGSLVLLALATAACGSSRDRSSSVPTTAQPSSIANAILHYEGPDPYGAPETTMLDVEGVVDLRRRASEVSLPVIATGVREVYVDGTWYIQLPGTTDAQQYEAIQLDGLTLAALAPTGVQPAHIATGAVAFVALAEAAATPSRREDFAVDLQHGVSSALRALGLATGAETLTFKRVMEPDGRATISAELALPSGRATITLALGNPVTRAAIEAPRADQVMRRTAA